MKRIWLLMILAVMSLGLSGCADKPLTEEDVKAQLAEKNQSAHDEIGKSTPRVQSPMATEPGETPDTSASSSAGNAGAGQGVEPYMGDLPASGGTEPKREPLPEPPADIKLDPRTNEYQHQTPGMPDGAGTPLTDPNTPVSSPASGG
ncbi:MAG: hypothetical protein KIT45_11935 [Fimbriimonadia bacterium]|nr:hypothetical protein [Fimbriimonadia bacterium]